MTMTREELQTRLASYLAAEAQILRAQEYVIGQGATARRLTRADLAEVTKTIASIRAEIALLGPLGRPVRRINYIRPY